MFQLKKGLPFLMVVLMPLFFAFETASNIVTAQSNDEFGGQLALRLEGENQYFLKRVFSKITRVELVELRTRKRARVLNVDEWTYNPESSELCLKEKMDHQKYKLMVRGEYRIPYTFKLKDVDLDTVTVLFDQRLASEGVDYQLDRLRKELQLIPGAFNPSQTKYCIVARRQSIGYYREDNKWPYEQLFLAEIVKRIGFINVHRVKLNPQGNPEIEVAKYTYDNPEDDMFVGVTNNRSDRELTQEMGFKICFPDSLLQYRLIFKSLGTCLKSAFSRWVGASYRTSSGSGNLLSIRIHSAQISENSTETERTGKFLRYFNEKGVGVTCARQYVCDYDPYSYFEKPALLEVYYAKFGHENRNYQINLYNKEHNLTEAQFIELVKEYIRQIFKD